MTILSCFSFQSIDQFVAQIAEKVDKKKVNSIHYFLTDVYRILFSLTLRAMTLIQLQDQYNFKVEILFKLEKIPRVRSFFTFYSTIARNFGGGLWFCKRGIMLIETFL